MKVIAFKIYDYKSIKDTGICRTSGDNITTLAGQNESGKTAILEALRDFDQAPGDPSKATDFLPDSNLDASPMVSVLFRLSNEDIQKLVVEDILDGQYKIVDHIEKQRELWIHRNLLTGEPTLDSSLAEQWANIPREIVGEEDGENSESADPAGLNEAEIAMEIKKFIEVLREYWPRFIYFDSFDDRLPRTFPVHQLSGDPNSIPQIVRDFINLAELNLDKITLLSENDRTLGNYLGTCSANISGDFLTYWKQQVNGLTSVKLQVEHQRDSSGILNLQFYVYDNKKQYPEQRSKGFLWFLSFFLRLAAEGENEYGDRLILIDEPGSYLHATAQSDVLRLFEERLSKKDQIIYSTHSPYLIPASTLHRLRVVLNDGPNGTKIADKLTDPMLSGEGSADVLSPIITAIGLDVQGGLGFTEETNLLVEGITDYYYLTTWIKKYNRKNLSRFHVIPGHEDFVHL